jgi:ketosteroid isomerase-like protein
MNRDEMDALVDRHYACEVAGDIAGLLETFTDDVSRRASCDVVSIGKDAARLGYEMLFSDLRLTAVENRQRWYTESALIDQSLFHAVAVGNPFGHEGRDRPIAFSMLHVFEFADGRISREDGWTDVLNIFRQLGD